MDEPSVGTVTPKSLSFTRPLQLVCGRRLESFELVYETYGEANAERSNAILLCHALSGHHHAAGYHQGQSRPGWWEALVGPGKAIDTDHFYVVCANNLGGCHGSTGPRSNNPASGTPWGADFPPVAVSDWVACQARLADHLKISRWAAVIGGSLGGMQALQWAIDHPERVERACLIACAARLSAQNIAFNEVSRQAILADSRPAASATGAAPMPGLGLARMIGHITYLSDQGMRARFDRNLRDHGNGAERDAEFQVQSYLHHQGRKFAADFDADTYLLMLDALNRFDPAADHDNDLAATLAHCRSRFLVVSFSTDWRFAPARSREMVDALLRTDKRVSYLNVDAPQGHDAFLFNLPRYSEALGSFLRSPAFLRSPKLSRP